MISGLIGKKIGMTSVFGPDGGPIPVTVIQVGPCHVMQIKTKDKEGYPALQLGFEDKRAQKVKKPDVGHAKKANTPPKKILREVPVPANDKDSYSLGQELRVEQVFAAGDLVDVTGTSIGKGFAGVMKRHHMKGADASHGSHESFRGGGSIGSATTPGRVLKGKKMPGRMGNERVTILSQKVIQVRPEDNVLLVHGVAPGHDDNYVIVRKAVKAKTQKKAKAA
jgi:large subunit ribosomal protein L3